MMSYKFSLLIFSLLILAGCGRPRYNVCPLKPVHKRAALYSEKKDGIKVRVKRLNQEQTNKLFRGRGKRLKQSRHGQGIVPLHFTIKNYHELPITVEKKDIELPLVDYAQVAKRMFSSTTKRVAALAVIGIGCTALTFAGSCVCGLVGAMSGLPIFIAASYGTGMLSGALLVGTPVVTYLNASGSREVNQLIYKDIYQKTVVDVLAIKPFSEETFLVFITEKDKKNRFAMKVKHENGNETLFAIDLNYS